MPPRRSSRRAAAGPTRLIAASTSASLVAPKRLLPVRGRRPAPASAAARTRARPSRRRLLHARRRRPREVEGGRRRHRQDAVGLAGEAAFSAPARPARARRTTATVRRARGRAPRTATSHPRQQVRGRRAHAGGAIGQRLRQQRLVVGGQVGRQRRHHLLAEVGLFGLPGPSIQPRASAGSVARGARSADRRASGVPSSQSLRRSSSARADAVDQPAPGRVVAREPAPALAGHVRRRRQQGRDRRERPAPAVPGAATAARARRCGSAPRRGSPCSGPRRHRRQSPPARASRRTRFGRRRLRPLTVARGREAGAGAHRVDAEPEQEGTFRGVSFARESRRSPGLPGSAGSVPPRPSPTSAVSISAFTRALR